MKWNSDEKGSSLKYAFANKKTIVSSDCTIIITEYHSEDLLFRMNNPKYPPYMTGYIVKFKSRYFYENINNIIIEDNYGYMIHELDPSSECQASFSSLDYIPLSDLIENEEE